MFVHVVRNATIKIFSRQICHEIISFMNGFVKLFFEYHYGFLHSNFGLVITSSNFINGPRLF